MKATGEQCDRCRWQKKGAERVAAIGERGRCAVTDEGTEYRNRNCQKSGGSCYNNAEIV